MSVSTTLTCYFIAVCYKPFLTKSSEKPTSMSRGRSYCPKEKVDYRPIYLSKNYKILISHVKCFTKQINMFSPHKPTSGCNLNAKYLPRAEQRHFTQLPSKVFFKYTKHTDTQTYTSHILESTLTF